MHVTADPPRTASAASSNRLTTRILVGLLLGIVVGYACHALLPDAQTAKTVSGYIGIATEIFLRLIKMIIAPLVFGTIVSGIVSLGDSKAVGRIAFKAMAWFITASLISLTLGLLFANLFTPGAHLGLPLPAADAQTGLQTSSLNVHDFLLHVFPSSVVQAMAQNEVLQILVFAVFFGFALAGVLGAPARALVSGVEGLVQVMLRVTDAVMRFAPVGVFAAMAAVITTQGLGILVTYGKFIGAFYVGLATLWCLLALAGWCFLGRSVVTLLKLLRAPMLVAFSTASSESAFPKMIEQLAAFGVQPRVTGFVLPLGYSFNLDGSMMYTAFAALFVAQAYDIPMSLGQQIALLLVMMVASKGIAGVPRASLVVIAATLPMFHLPVAGLLLIIGVDQLLDMGRTMTNVIGNGIATAVVAKWEGALDRTPPLPAQGGRPVMAAARSI